MQDYLMQDLAFQAVEGYDQQFVLVSMKVNCDESSMFSSFGAEMGMIGLQDLPADSSRVKEIVAWLILR